jgi:small nuclear ribonucleoprotein (snRNP)-like protein
MSRFWRLQRRAAFLWISLAVMAPACHAGPKKDHSAAIQRKVAKLGWGHWVLVKEKNGRTLEGLLAGAGDQSFKMQLHNSREFIDVPYADVVRVRGSDLTSKKALIFWGVDAAIVTGAVLVIRSQFGGSQPKTPQPAPTPPQPR